MEGNFSQGEMIPGCGSYGGVDLQESTRLHNHALQHHHHSNPCHGASVCPSIHEDFPLKMGNMRHSDQIISLTDYDKGERGKSSVSGEDEPSFTEEGVDGQNDGNIGKKGSWWQRVKWADKMVRLLITAVSYIGDDTEGGCGVGMRRKFAVIQKKGKWKSISKVMAERGFRVSPQQCEDKFNDLNKRYKKLNDMIGRGISCQVVENPALLDVIDYLTEKEKDDVRKILSSKHLFYEEMCSYHNGNRLHLPHDPQLQRSLQLAFRSRNYCENDDVRRQQHDDLEDDDDDDDDDDGDMETDDHDEFEENHADNRGIYGVLGGSAKRSRQGQVHEDACFKNPLNSQDCGKSSFSFPPITRADINQVPPENSDWLQKQWIESRSLKLEEQKLQIQVEKLELEKQCFKWQRFNKKRDRELEKMRMENERMKLENERMALELKRKELDVD